MPPELRWRFWFSSLGDENPSSSQTVKSGYKRITGALPVDSVGTLWVHVWAQPWVDQNAKGFRGLWFRGV